MFRKAEGRHARAFQLTPEPSMNGLCLDARIGAALIAAHETKQDAFGAIASVIPWERFRSSVAEAETLARPEEFDAYQVLGERHAGVRRWSPAFLEAFEFESVPASASLMRARPSSFGTPDIWNAPSMFCASSKTYPLPCWPICLRSAGNM